MNGPGAPVSTGQDGDPKGEKASAYAEPIASNFIISGLDH